MRVLQKNAGVQRMLENIDRYQKLHRSAIGPLDELCKKGVFDQVLLVSRQLELVRHAMADFEARFRLPEIAETAGLLAEFWASPVSEALTRYTKQTSNFQSAVESMQTPWLDIKEFQRSMGGFAALQGIGHALKEMPAFGHDLGAALRIDLGDWRDKITWPREIFTDHSARADFYVSLGFNPALTDFPAPAFNEILHIADLGQEPPPLFDQYEPPVPAADVDKEEEGLTRTNRAHYRITKLETQMRRFIDALMTEAFGPDWPKHKLPNKLYGRWQEKKAKQRGDREFPLIDYADFTDYEAVIGKRDNWNVFEPIFGRKEDILESLQRMHLIRVDTMHARPITQDDELLLCVETRRVGVLMEEFVRCLITKPSKVFNRYFGPEHGVELSQPKRYGYTPVEFADESER